MQRFRVFGRCVGIVRCELLELLGKTRGHLNFSEKGTIDSANHVASFVYKYCTNS